MLKIRPEQWELFDRLALERFVQRVAIFLRQHFDEELASVNDSELTIRVEKQISEGKSIDIVKENDLIDFCSLCTVLGDNFIHQYDWAKIIVDNPGLSTGTAKLEELRRSAMHFMKNYETPA